MGGKALRRDLRHTRSIHLARCMHALGVMPSSRPSPARTVKRRSTPVTRLLADLPAASLPTCSAPMLATLGTMPSPMQAFGYEVKWDGYRAVARWDGTKMLLCSRNGHDFSTRFAEILPLGPTLQHPAVLDGEIVALDHSGQPSFSALQTRMPRLGGSSAHRSWDPQHYRLQFMIFDILHYAGKSTCALPYADRRLILESLDLTGPSWQVPPMHPDGPELLTIMKSAGQEGIIAKRLTSPYTVGRRSTDWIKIKLSHQDAFLIVGYWTSGASPVGSLLLGCYATAADAHAGHQPRFCGKVGTGFSEQDRERLRQLLQPLTVAAPPVSGRLPHGPGITWCQPRLIAQIRFGEWTHANHLRHPTFLGMRSDLTSRDVVQAHLRAS